MKRRFVMCLSMLLAALAYGQQAASSQLASLLASAQRAQSANDYATAAADYQKAVKLRADVPELWANLGLMQHEAADYSGAIKSFTEANRLNPSLYVPNLFLGIEYVHAGRAKESLPLLARAERMNDRDPLPSLTLGRAYSSLGEYRLAAQELERTIQIDARQSSAWFALGIVNLHMVEADSRALTEKDADSPYAKALYAEALARQSRNKEAAATYGEVLAAKERPPCMAAEAGFVASRQGDGTTAGQDFRLAPPECSLALLGQARLDLEGDKQDAALALLRDAWSRDHGFFAANAARVFTGMNAEATQGLLTALTVQKGAGASDSAFQAAIGGAARGEMPEYLAEAVASPPQQSLPEARKAYAAGHYRECAEHLNLKAADAAASQLLATCAFFTGNAQLASDAGAALHAIPGHGEEGLYWSIKAREKLAFEALAHYQQLEPDSARSHILLGDIYRQRERFDNAQEEYKRALEIAPGSPAALLGLASAYLGDAKIDLAIETAKLALAKDSDDPETNILLGEALVAQHRYDEAEPALLKGLHAKPQMLPHVHALLGETYAAQGKTQPAIAELRQGLSSDEDGSLHYQLARIYRNAGEKAEAEIAIAQMKELQQKRRKASIVAVQDSHSSSLDDEP